MKYFPFLLLTLLLSESAVLGASVCFLFFFFFPVFFRFGARVGCLFFWDVMVILPSDEWHELISLILLSMRKTRKENSESLVIYIFFIFRICWIYLWFELDSEAGTISGQRMRWVILGSNISIRNMILFESKEWESPIFFLYACIFCIKPFLFMLKIPFPLNKLLIFDRNVLTEHGSKPNSSLVPYTISNPKLDITNRNLCGPLMALALGCNADTVLLIIISFSFLSLSWSLNKMDGIHLIAYIITSRLYQYHVRPRWFNPPCRWCPCNLALAYGIGTQTGNPTACPHNQSAVRPPTKNSTRICGMLSKLCGECGMPNAYT